MSTLTIRQLLDSKDEFTFDERRLEAVVLQGIDDGYNVTVHTVTFEEIVGNVMLLLHRQGRDVIGGVPGWTVTLSDRDHRDETVSFLLAASDYRQATGSLVTKWINADRITDDVPTSLLEAHDPSVVDLVVRIVANVVAVANDTLRDARV